LAMLRGVSMGLCMMPVQTAAYNTVPREQLPRATALSNVLMRIFGAFSTATLSSILHDRTGFHYVRLASDVRADSPGLVLTLETLHRTAADAFHLAPGTLQMLYQLTRQSATVMAFDDTFLVMSVMSLVGLGLACFVHDPGL